MRSRVSIDKFGRIVIPAEIRRKLGIRAGSEFFLELRGTTILLRPIRSIDETIDEWFEKMINMHVEAKYFRVKDDKWISDEYVKKKLGLD